MIHTVLALSGVAFDHLVTGLEARECHIRDRILLMMRLLGRYNGSKGGEGEMNTGETENTLARSVIEHDHKHSRDQVRLELVQVHVEGAVKTKRGGDGRYDLRDESVQIRKTGRRDVQVLFANVVNGLIINLRRRDRMSECTAYNHLRHLP